MYQVTRKPIVSRASILILSGFLIGLSFADYVRADLRHHVLTCGLVGLIAFVGLHFAALRREDEAAKKRMEGETERVQELMSQNLAKLQQSLHARFKEIVHEARVQAHLCQNTGLDHGGDSQAAPADRFAAGR